MARGISIVYVISGVKSGGVYQRKRIGQAAAARKQRGMAARSGMAAIIVSAAVAAADINRIASPRVVYQSADVTMRSGASSLRNICSAGGKSSV